MKFALAILVCLLASISVQAQNGSAEQGEQSAERISLGKKVADSGIVEDVTVFGPRDIPVYCFIDLASGSPSELRFEVVAVSATGLRKNSKIVAVSYRTNEGEVAVTFTAKPRSVWAAGDYRADILIDGRLAGSILFKITKDGK